MGLEGRREKPLLFYAQAKENPAKGRVFRLLVGRVSEFPLREEALLTDEYCLRNPAEQVLLNPLID